MLLIQRKNMFQLKMNNMQYRRARSASMKYESFVSNLY